MDITSMLFGAQRLARMGFSREQIERVLSEQEFDTEDDVIAALQRDCIYDDIEILQGYVGRETFSLTDEGNIFDVYMRHGLKSSDTGLGQAVEILSERAIPF